LIANASVVVYAYVGMSGGNTKLALIDYVLESIPADLLGPTS
jgi:hypothetical protein